MKAQLWKIKVCNSVLDYSHNFSQSILELFLSKYSITVNYSNGVLHYFKSDSNRYKQAELITTAIDFPKDVAESMNDNLKKEEEIENQVKNLFDSLNKKYPSNEKISDLTCYTVYTS